MSKRVQTCSIHSYENGDPASCKCRTFTFGSGSFLRENFLGHLLPTLGCPTALVGTGVAPLPPGVTLGPGVALGPGAAPPAPAPFPFLLAFCLPPLTPTLVVFFMRTMFEMNSHQFSNFATAHVFWWCHTYLLQLCFLFYAPGTALDLVSMRNSSCAVFGGNSKSEQDSVYQD